MIFVTGSTGFLGQELLAELLKSRSGSEKLCLLIRPKSGSSAEDRFTEIIERLNTSSGLAKSDLVERLEFVEGDISQPRFGLSPADYSSLVTNTKEIVHCGASVSFTQSLEKARKTNVAGTEEILALSWAVKSCNSDRANGNRPLLNYVSTAYVAGDKEKIVSASDLDVSHRFKNSYEKSKAEAEKLVRESWGEIPLHIYRPSIIVGDSRTGYSSSFTTIFVMLKVFMRDIFQTFPANPYTSIDLVPVDYVAKSIAEISKAKPGDNPCYHICAGVDRDTSIKEIIHCLGQFLEKNGYRKLNFPTMTKPDGSVLKFATINLAVSGFEMFEHAFESFVGKRKSLLQRVYPYLLYANRNPRFNMDPTLERISGSIEPAPLFPEYAENIFSYWLNNDRDFARMNLKPAQA
jgi:thioester reductase-like protein